MSFSEVLKSNLSLVVSTLIGLVIGILLVALPGDVVIKVAFVLLGIAIILCNINPFITSIKNLKYKTPVAFEQFGEAVLIMVLALLLIFLREQYVSIILGIILILLVVIPPFIFKLDFITTLKNHIFTLVLGVCLIIFGAGAIAEVLLNIIGWIIIISSIIELVYLVYLMITLR